MLKSAGALSNLFSDNETPYIVSRIVENAYCVAFSAENIGRSDCSADANLDGVGIGLKTFIHANGKTLQKIAEFNKDANLYRNQLPKQLIQTIANLRNERIELTMRTYGLNSMIYHCITRSPGKIFIFESPMDLIDIKNIKNIIFRNKNTITFDDGLSEYSFNLTKSTLYKRFIFEEPLAEIPVSIVEQPYLVLEKLFNDPELEPSNNTKLDHVAENGFAQSDKSLILQDTSNQKYHTNEYVILPLYSDHGNKRHVQEKSGLNQWNASGRKRHPDEIYIPIPKWIHNVFTNFFPPRDISFQLKLPDKTVLSAKVCQDGSKALMSNPNRDLGNWILRKVLKLPVKEILTYEKLEILGIDSVIIYKHNSSHYSINFCEIGSFDEFQSEYTNN